jgi:hypothetical protein
VPSTYDAKQEWTALFAEVDWKLGPLALGVDEKHGVAWFHGAVALDIDTLIVGMNCCDTTKDAMRMSGVVVQDGKAWRLVALALSRQLPDAQLFKGGKEDIATSLDADDASAPIDKQILATWFARRGLAASRAMPPRSPKEHLDAMGSPPIPPGIQP